MIRPRQRLAVGAAALAIVVAACGGSAASDPAISDQAAASDAIADFVAPEGDPAPTQSFALFDGSDTDLAAFAGQPVVVNFWASWCPSCVAEMSAAFAPVAERLDSEVTFVGMNIQDQRELALQLLEETGVDWVNAEDPDGELYLELGGLGMPFTIYLNAEGEVVHTHNGPLNEQQLADAIAENFGIVG